MESGRAPIPVSFERRAKHPETLDAPRDKAISLLKDALRRALENKTSRKNHVSHSSLFVARRGKENEETNRKSRGDGHKAALVSQPEEKEEKG